MAISDIQTLASRALLSQAAYARTETRDDLERALKENANFTATQVSDFVNRYDFVTTRPNELNGFSATVYQEKASGRYILATRGTEFDPAGVATDFLGADAIGIGAF